jgi:coproporphyrinogen III oxidase
VAESKRPFNIVNDRGFQSLMKTGRPEYYIPSPTTVSRDVKQVFVNVRKRMAKMLQEHEGNLNFATDVWTSLNHKAFIAVTVHFEVNGVPMSMLLDLKEVATSHSGVNLAEAFAQILKEFSISAKVSVHSVQYNAGTY